MTVGIMADLPLWRPENRTRMRIIARSAGDMGLQADVPENAGMFGEVEHLGGLGLQEVTSEGLFRAQRRVDPARQNNEIARGRQTRTTDQNGELSSHRSMTRLSSIVAPSNESLFGHFRMTRTSRPRSSP